MTPDRTIALLASIGACLSAIATFWTIQQMAKQRRDSYRPDLTLSQVPVTGTRDPKKGKSPLPIVWSTDQSIASTTWQVCTIPLLNLGFGAAKNIVVSWSFNLDHAVKMINDFSQRTLIPVRLTNKNGILDIESQAWGLQFAIMWRNQQVDTVDYVLPTRVQDSPVQLTVPHAYIAVVTTLLYLQFK
jgi:hypothetical protein